MQHPSLLDTAAALTEATQIYLHADMTIKERAVARTTLPPGRPGRYTAPDTLLTFLETL